MQHLASLIALIIATTGLALGQTKSYPKPQIASAAGALAPDFTLKDQDGKDLKLSSQHGHWVLLFFYRGYW